MGEQGTKTFRPHGPGGDGAVGPDQKLLAGLSEIAVGHLGETRKRGCLAVRAVDVPMGVGLKRRARRRLNASCDGGEQERKAVGRIDLREMDAEGTEASEERCSRPGGALTKDDETQAGRRFGRRGGCATSLREGVRGFTEAFRLVRAPQPRRQLIDEGGWIMQPVDTGQTSRT